MKKNKNYPELYDIDMEKEYFNNIVQISKEYLRYINSYKRLTIDYIKGLISSQKSFDEKIKIMINQFKNQKTINFNYFLTVINSIPKINMFFIENIYMLIKGIDNTIGELEKYIQEKLYLVDKFFNSINVSKNDLLTKINDLEKEKKNLFESLSQTEKSISNFFINKLNKDNYPENNNKVNNLNSNNTKNFSIQNLEDNMNKSINESKKLEKNYKSLISITKVFKKAYIDLSNINYENIRNITYNLFNEIKKFNEDKIILLKNSFSISLKEININLSKLIVKKENNEKLLKDLLLNSEIKANDEYPITPKKYNLKIFKKNLDDKNNKPFTTIEDGLEEINFIEEDIDFYTAKAMLSNFEYIDNKYKIDFKEEEEKRNTRKIISNILYNKEKKAKNFGNKNNNEDIVENKKIKSKDEHDINQLYSLLDKHYNRVIFLQTMSQFRTSGEYSLPLQVFEIVGKCLLIIIDKILRDDDYNNAKTTIILSQTYFCIKQNKRYYLHNIIKDHKLFYNLEFWRKTLDISIKNEIIRCLKINNNKNNKTISKELDNILNEKDIDFEKYSDSAFGQIASIANSMIDFNIDIKDIKSIIEPKEQIYKLNQNHKKNIELIIENTLNIKILEESKEKKENNKKKEKNNENNIDINNNEINMNSKNHE